MTLEPSPMHLPDVENHTSNQSIQNMKAEGMAIPQIMHLFAFKPGSTDFLARFTQQVMRGQSPLSAGERELIAAFTSSHNECPF